MKKHARFLAFGASVALLAAACGGGGGGTTSKSTQAGFKKGGTLRVAIVSDVHQALDPGREYYTIGWEFLKCCLARTLLSFNFKGPNEGGNDLAPDLATGPPDSTSDGLTWTFHIRSGVHYAPPLQNVTVTAQDFIRAIMRLGDKKVAASYPFYYSPIEGFDDFAAGKAKTISGLSAPDPMTLQVKLAKPVGYLPYTFTMAATAPVPPSPSDPNAPLGVATGHDQNYGQFIVSSGPYMWKGADAIDFSKPADQQAGPPGFQAGKSYVLVRNPSWNASIDPLRKAYLNEIDVTVGGTVADVTKRIEAGELDTMDALPAPEGIRDYATNATLKPFIHSDPTFGTWYINMNTAMPPFDDVHVRKAMNWIVDKAGLLRLVGGQIQGPIATHTIPNSMVPSLANYDPYATPDHQGDPAKAKQEMMQSKYDTNHDGMCDAPACKNVLMVIDQTDPQPKMAALIQQDVQQIGISLNLKQFQTTTMYTKCETATERVPACPSEGWYADFADPYAFVTGLFSSVSLTPSCCDDSEMGATTAQLKEWKYTDTTPTPSIDDQLSACIPTQGDQREQCYANVDKALMENVVPWVPYRFANQVVITSTKVRNYHLDASTGWISLSQVALAG